MFESKNLRWTWLLLFGAIEKHTESKNLFNTLASTIWTGLLKFGNL